MFGLLPLAELIKFSAIVFAELLILLVVWLLWFRRPSSVASSIQLDSESSGSESDKSPSQVPENTVDPKLLQLPAPKVVAGKAVCSYVETVTFSLRQAMGANPLQRTPKTQQKANGEQFGTASSKVRTAAANNPKSHTRFPSLVHRLQHHLTHPRKPTDSGIQKSGLWPTLALKLPCPLLRHSEASGPSQKLQNTQRPSPLQEAFDPIFPAPSNITRVL